MIWYDNVDFGTEGRLQRIVESGAIALRTNRDGVSGDYREPSARPNPALHQTGKRKKTQAQRIDNRFRFTRRHQYSGGTDAGRGTGRAMYHRARRELRRDR